MTLDASVRRSRLSLPPPLSPQLLFMTDGTRVGMGVRDRRHKTKGHQWWAQQVQPVAPLGSLGQQIQGYLDRLPGEPDLHGLDRPRDVVAVCSGPTEADVLRELRDSFHERARVSGVPLELVLAEGLMTSASTPSPDGGAGIRPIPASRAFDLDRPRKKGGAMVVYLDPERSSVQVKLRGLPTLAPSFMQRPANPHALRLAKRASDSFTTWEALILHVQESPALLARVLAVAVLAWQCAYEPLVRTVVFAGPLARRLSGRQESSLARLTEPFIQVGVLEGLPDLLFRGSLLLKLDALEG